MTWRLDANNGSTRRFDTRAEAEATKAELEELGLSIDLTHETDTQAQTVSDGGSVESDGTNAVAVPDSDDGEAGDLPAASDVTEDPLSWMPDHFIDQIEGVPSINRKGYAVLAEHYDISVTAEPLTIPSESDWEYAEFRAVATTPDGREYSGFGSAHVERGDDKVLLGEMAETRAVKRATSNATGVGMTAVAEMRSATEEER
jgi:hypothetical protein